MVKNRMLFLLYITKLYRIR